MFSFLNKKNKVKSVPKWANFFNHKEYSLFIDEISRYFENLNIEYVISDGQINVKNNNFGFHKLGLTNVAQTCKQDELKFYRKIIEDHFNSLIRAYEFDNEFDKIILDFEKVKKYIGVRLYDNEYISNIGKDLVLGKQITDDIFGMIVFDLPESIMNIKPEKIKPWNKSENELFDIGKQNIKEKYEISISKENFGEFSIWFCNCDHFYTPNIIFELANRTDLIGR